MLLFARRLMHRLMHQWMALIKTVMRMVLQTEAPKLHLCRRRQQTQVLVRGKVEGRAVLMPML